MGPITGLIVNGGQGFVQGLQNAVTAFAGGPIAVIASVAAALLAKKPSSNTGTQTSFKADPNAGIPYVMGRTLVGGNLVYWEPHDSKNKYQSLVAVLSGGGPIESIDQTYLDKEEINFAGGLTGAAIGDLSTLLNQDVQLGATPETTQLSTGIGTPPGWDSSSLISGMAASMLTMKFDPKGDITLTSTPRMGWLMHGVKVYDPRLDSTYPGGSGAHRSDDESTWEWSDNAFLHGLTFAIGRHQNGKRVLGVGMPIDQIDVANFVEGANVFEANGWKIGGQIETTGDKWNDLKRILAAGGGEPIRYGARLSCVVNAPKVVLDTIDYKQIIGEASIPSMQGRRVRINGAIPSYRSEDHGWEVVAAGMVRNSTYLAEDGTERTEELGSSSGLLDFVQCFEGDTPDQAAQLAGYYIANSREARPITLPLKPRWIGYRVGDCLECDASEANLEGRQLVVIGRSIDVSTGAVPLTFRTEDPDKHDWALGLTGVAAPLPEPVVRPPLNTPDAADWALTGTSLTSSGGSVPALVVDGGVDDPNIEAIIFEYRLYDVGNGDEDNWIGNSLEAPSIVRKEITSVTPDTDYEVSVSYRQNGIIGGRLILGPETTGEGVIDYDGGDAGTEV
jgi:hypothetical protein